MLHGPKEPRCVGNQLSIQKCQQCPPPLSDVLFTGELISPFHKPVPPSSKAAPIPQIAEITLGVSKMQIPKSQTRFKVTPSLEIWHQITHQLHPVYYWCGWISYFFFSFINDLSKTGNLRLVDFVVICFAIKTGLWTGLVTIPVNFSLYLNIDFSTVVAHWYFSSDTYNIFFFNKLFNSWHHSSFANVLCVVSYGSVVWNYLWRNTIEDAAFGLPQMLHLHKCDQLSISEFFSNYKA